MARVRRGAAEWAVWIDEWRSSGLSLPAFCQRHGLSRGTMQNWVYKPELKRAVEEARRSVKATDEPRAERISPRDESPVFLPVQVVEAAAGVREDHTGVEVVLSAGRRIVLGAGFDADTLRRVVAVLEERSC
jgi:hypothetical protein